jgi:hypothetical protein
MVTRRPRAVGHGTNRTTTGKLTGANHDCDRVFQVMTPIDRARRTHSAGKAKKKAGMVGHTFVFHHAGLLVNEPPESAGLPFV